MSTETNTTEKGFLMQKMELNFSELCAFVTEVFGASEYSTLIEPNICLIASRLSPQYCCGSWTHYKTRAGAFLMIPDTDAMFQVKSPNGRERVMSADAFGVVACRFAYSHLSFQLTYAGYAELAAVVKEQLFLLNDYLDGHKEANAIYEICD